MIPGPFDYFAPSTVDEAVSLLSDHGPDARVLAGGQSLIPMMKLRLAEPGVLVEPEPRRGARRHRGAGPAISGSAR